MFTWIPVDYIDKSFKVEAMALARPVYSAGAQAMGFTRIPADEAIEYLKNRVSPLTGEVFGQPSPKTLSRLHCRLLSADETVNALFTLLPFKEQRDFARRVCIPAAEAAQRAEAAACKARFKDSGIRRVVQAEPITISCLHVCARPVPGKAPQINIHFHPLSATSVVLPDGRVRSEHQAQARDWVRKHVREVFQRTLAAEAEKMGYPAEYCTVTGVCKIKGLHPDFVKAVTGARARQISEYLEEHKLPETWGTKFRANRATAGPKPQFSDSFDVHAVLSAARADALRVVEDLQKKKGIRAVEIPGLTSEGLKVVRGSVVSTPFGLYPLPKQIPSLPPELQPSPRVFERLPVIVEGGRPYFIEKSTQEEVLKARMPHIFEEIEKASKKAYTHKRGRLVVVHDGLKFLNETRKIAALEAVRKQALDQDWNGVAAIGRIFAAWIKAKLHQAGPDKGSILLVPKREWRALKDEGLLPMFYARAQSRGWTLRMAGMDPEAHARRSRNANRAVRRGVHRRQRFDGGYQS